MYSFDQVILELDNAIALKTLKIGQIGLKND